jgi:hypothetical protein
MKYISILFAVFLISYSTQAQQYKSDFGIIVGGTYYNGDLNPNKLFHDVQYSLGALVRFNLNKRYAIRLSGYYMSLSSSEKDSKELNLPYGHAPSFSTNLLDLSGQFEFNFLPYQTGEEKWTGTPYIAAGIGYSVGLSNGINFLSVPFGIGYKFNVTDRLSAGLEWSYRKTFNDKIDNTVSPLGTSILHNNDWYSTFGLLITYKFVKFAGDCAVYK